MVFERAQEGGYSELAVDGLLYLEACLQVGPVNYRLRVVEGTVGESE